MKETLETPVQETSESPAPPATRMTPRTEVPKIFKAAAWVAVVTGTLVIVAGIFFAGFGFAVYGNHAGQPHHRQLEYPAMVMEVPHGNHGAPNHAAPLPAPSPTPGH
ncbi:hypothetical protein [Mycobacterium pseudokansasii]|uniref:hypothetical protein n=1 Tax=Mycobacterium pseudokansasii TaxID=2341080 RepID=UPI0010A96BF4|nr:hypothetical protein [Mycobacterium pseudokansasii]